MYYNVFGDSLILHKKWRIIIMNKTELVEKVAASAGLTKAQADAWLLYTAGWLCL